VGTGGRGRCKRVEIRDEKRRHGVEWDGRKSECKGGDGKRQTAGSEEATELGQGAREPFFGGVGREGEGGGDIEYRLLPEEAEKQEGAISIREAGDRIVEMRQEFWKIGRVRGCGLVADHGGDLSFVLGAPGAKPDGIAGGVAGGEDEPTGKGAATAECVCFASQEKEDGLGDIFGEGGIASLTDSGGVDEAAVTMDQNGKGRLGAVMEEVIEEERIRGGVGHRK
jgi:hypothetical protein